MNQRRRIAWTVVGFVFFAVVLQCIGVWIPGIEIALSLSMGWISFLYRVVPKLTVRWDLIASAAAYVVVLTVGTHLFLRWLFREMRNAGDGPRGASVVPAAWRWRWTLSLVTLVFLLFAAGTAAVGIVHQTTWLARSPEPLYRRGGILAQRILCASNLRQIGRALDVYAAEHGKKYPDDFGALIAHGDLTAELFVCPSSNHDLVAKGDTPQQTAGALLEPGHCSYVYLGKGLVQPVGETRVIAVEILENHQGDGINVLYGDGHADWLDRAKAESLLSSLGWQSAEIRRPERPAPVTRP